MLSCEISEIFKNHFFYRTPLVAASLYILVYIAGPILESKGMRAIFQKKGKIRVKNGKVSENLGKNLQNLKMF